MIMCMQKECEIRNEEWGIVEDCIKQAAILTDSGLLLYGRSRTSAPTCLQCICAKGIPSVTAGRQRMEHYVFCYPFALLAKVLLTTLS